MKYNDIISVIWSIKCYCGLKSLPILGCDHRIEKRVRYTPYCDHKNTLPPQTWSHSISCIYLLWSHSSNCMLAITFMHSHIWIYISHALFHIETFRELNRTKLKHSWEQNVKYVWEALKRPSQARKRFSRIRTHKKRFPLFVLLLFSFVLLLVCHAYIYIININNIFTYLDTYWLITNCYKAKFFLVSYVNILSRFDRR